MSNSFALHQGNIPLYKQLEKQIRSEIDNGTYPVHTKIPSEMELCAKYNVSRVTVRKALSELTDEGVLVPQQGKGTYVSIPLLCRNLREVNSFHDTCKMTGTAAGACVLKAHMVAPTESDIADLLLGEGEKVVEIIRIRTADDMPVMLETNHFPQRYDYLLTSDLTGSIYAVLAANGVSVEQGIHEISLAHATALQAEQLGIKEDDALIRLKEIMYDSNGMPLHTSDQLIRGDRFTFRI